MTAVHGPSTANTHTIFHVNIRSLCANFDRLIVFLKTYNQKPLAIFLTECWEVTHPELFLIPGYQPPIIMHAKRGGGIAAYIRDDITYRILTFDVAVEQISLILTKNNRDMCVACAIYRRHQQSVTEFLENLDSMMENFSVKRVPTYILGDFNINTLAITVNTENYNNTISNNGFKHLITDPTRVTETSTTCIDHILTNSTSNVEGKCVASHIADHYPVVASFTSKEHNTIATHATKHLFYHDVDASCRFWFLLSQRLKSLDIPHTDVNTSTENFIKILTQASEKFTISVKLKDKCTKSWVTNRIKNAIAKRDKAFLRMKGTDSDVTAKNRFKYLRNKVTSLIRSEKQNYYSSKISADIDNSSYDTVNELLGKKKSHNVPDRILSNGREISNRYDIACVFNETFVKVGPNLAAAIPDSDVTFDVTHNNQTMFLKPISPEEVEFEIQKLKKKAPGNDGISAKLLQHVSPLIAPYLSQIFNQCLVTGIFPECLKIARITPIYKSGPKEDVLNYRPISGLNALAKLFEKLIYKRFVDFIESNNLLSGKQFGFRRNRSTVQALTEIIEKIRNGENAKDGACCVLLDLSKAFDTLNHDILLQKIERYGFRGMSQDLIRNYLSNRYQYVQLGETHSTRSRITCGVPQGSVLGPLLFLLYINDLTSVCHNSTPYMFADDTNLTAFNKTRTTLMVQNDVTTVNEWMKYNKLSLNVQKSSLLSFNCTIQEPVRCGNNQLPVTTQSKYLGVILDNELNFKHHVNHVVKKLSKQSGIICKLRQVLSRPVLLSYYRKYVEPHIQYGILAYGGTSKTSLLPILKAQKKIMRLIYFKRRTDSSYQHFEDARIPNVYEIYVYELLKFITGCLKNQHSTNFLNNLVNAQHQTNYRTRFGENHYSRLPTCRIELMRKSVRYRGIRLLNILTQNGLLPDILRMSKCLYKKFLKNTYNNYILGNDEIINQLFHIN